MMMSNTTITRALRVRAFLTRRFFVRLAIAAGVLMIAAIAGLVLLVLATSSPPVRIATFATPNTQARSSAGALVDTTGLLYQDTAHPRAANPDCVGTGQWLLDVNPQDVVGYPYATPPQSQDWRRAAAASAAASAICPAPIVVTWFAHNPRYPASDRWTAVIPISITAAISGPALQSYAAAHSRQT